MFPVISETGWYTLYLSKGYYQEGETAARYLNMNMSKQQGKVVQIVQPSPEGQALARGFKETWQETGHPEVTTVVMDQSDETSEKVLRELILRERPSALAVWAGDSTLQTLQHLASIEDSPRFIFVSVTSLGKEMVSVPEKIRTATYITYPFRLPAAEERYNLYIAPFKGNTGRLPTDIFLKQSYDTTILLTAALMDMRGKYFRDNFLDVIGMMRDQDLPLYERLSFGPGQRYASKGCYIVQIGAGTGAEMIRKSDWVIH
jgi:hypothetical protein